MLKFEILVFKASTPDRSASSSVTTCEITTLNHEIRDNSMELATFKCQFEIIVNNVAFTESDKILNSLRDLIAKHINDDVSCNFSSNINCESDSVCRF